VGYFPVLNKGVVSMVWLLIVGVGLATYATRASCIVLAGKLTIPVPVQQALRLVPPAILSALVCSQLGRAEGGLLVSSAPRLVAALVAALVAWRTKSVLWTISVGMLTLWGCQWLTSFG
jgi:branched-subunit amino acid transport protein